MAFNNKLGRQNEFFTDLLLGNFYKQLSLSVSLKCENAQQAPYEYYIKWKQKFQFLRN